jgi:hypothetical protein
VTKLPLFLASVFVVIAGAAVAKSPNKPPKIMWATHSGDQRVDASYLENCFQEKKLSYGSDGTEVYHKNGSYTYRTSGGNYDAPSYKFYANGVRCINYANPRFDLYVVNEKCLILVNAKGWRGEGTLKQ